MKRSAEEGRESGMRSETRRGCASQSINVCEDKCSVGSWSFQHNAALAWYSPRFQRESLSAIPAVLCVRARSCARLGIAIWKGRNSSFEYPSSSSTIRSANIAKFRHRGDQAVMRIIVMKIFMSQNTSFSNWNRIRDVWYKALWNNKRKEKINSYKIDKIRVIMNFCKENIYRIEIYATTEKRVILRLRISRNDKMNFFRITSHFQGKTL